MHGRLKVKSTAEQLEAKRKEREKKLQLYNGAKSKIFEKKINGELDEELLLLSGEVLAVNPDFYTLWNYRKETFLELKKIKSKEELQKIFQSELHFLETCLKINPKSYGSWHQRCFVMDNMPEPDWSRELELCNQFLQYDERNFHCWDYRRFIVKRANVSLEAEFEFSMSKISNNFSNYSSWHYRSKLLPILFPDPTQPMGVDEKALLKEYELVQNGFFTDPDDQSNWFYHRWLMGRGKLKPDWQKQALHCFSVSRTDRCVILSLVKHIQVGKSTDIILECNNSILKGVTWQNQEKSTRFSTLWISFHSNNVTLPENGDLFIKVKILQGGEEICFSSMSLKENEVNYSAPSLSTGGVSRFSQELSVVKTETLQHELEAVSQLLEMETDNKWAVLTLVLLMKALDPVLYHAEIMNNLDKLAVLDTKRINYYKDLKSKFIVENMIDALNDSLSTSIDLSQRDLTKFYHYELLPLVISLDLSYNRLNNVQNFNYLQSIIVLNLNSNNLKSLEGLQYLPKLERLLVRNNGLSSPESLRALQTCPNLKFLDLSGNPVCENEVSHESIREQLQDVDIVFKETS
ncbi:unnamed protein product [Lymnaea stagnalis]|uniref:Geranylgeranyl transferase type-2 subunit alpha n=1 Tax=Lymnaea stagnalis TaxID=6523 RepID=A0AAV2HES3_LYMST